MLRGHTDERSVEIREGFTKVATLSQIPHKYYVLAHIQNALTTY